MQTLERRLAELERTTAKKNYNITVHFIDATDDELLLLTNRKGKQWTRNANEPEQDFKARAFGETTRNAYGVAFLYRED